MSRKPPKSNQSPSPSPPPPKRMDDVGPPFPDNLPKTAATSNHTKPLPPQPTDYLFDNACVLDMDYFVKTISGIKSKGVRPDLVGSIIAHYSSKWLPDLSPTAISSSSNHHNKTITTNTTASSSGSPDDQDSSSSTNTSTASQQETITAVLNKKRFFVETLVGILPRETAAVPCNFLLRLLRVASMVGADPVTCRGELEGRIACQLDQADLKELMIPSFSHTCGTLLDIDLVIRLVRRFLMTATTGSGADGCGGSRSGAAVIKVARLVDSYLAEAAVDANLGLAEFIDIAGALPAHARPSDDGLYRAIDTYLKAHPNVTKQERKLLCRLIDSRKLSSEASLHASQNERLPVRAVIQVLFSEQAKLARHLDWSGGGGSRSCPSPAAASGFDQLAARSLSKREAVILTQQGEIRKLREDLLRLQTQCNAMQGQMDRLLANTTAAAACGHHSSSKKKNSSGGGGGVINSKGFFTKWRKIGMIPSFRNHHAIGDVVSTDCSSNLKFEDDYFYGRDHTGGEINVAQFGCGRQAGGGAGSTPMETRSKPVKGRATPKRWRKSTS